MSDRDFNDLALKIFDLQYELNPVYREFVSNLNLNPNRINHWKNIPCLPISFFKTHKILLHKLKPVQKFLSSGTTGQERSTKYLTETDIYKKLSKQIFEKEFGSLEQYYIFALLPSYLDNSESSLIYMVNYFIKSSGSNGGGFYNRDFENLITDLEEARNTGRNIILWGVSFALLDLAEKYSPDLSDIMVFETGGMKGRKKEITREELHQIIREKTGAKEIFSEYGMTELMSQAYSFGITKYRMPNTLRIQAMELNDPMSSERNGRIGSLNIIDLGNIETCSFIATEDLGRVYEDGTFEVLGRKDSSEIRGCNLMSA
ncbi:acyl transferase [Hyphobacterium sp. CCMP332]|nr:acyl transferase [Hyphobacterium sp. CCMP332]